jgi:serine/threonine-protein kinase
MQPGDQVGRYRVEELLEANPPRIIARAVDPGSGVAVAIKALAPSARTSRDAEGRFTREIRVLENLAHSGLPRLIDTGHFEDGSPYLVMELLEGTTLAGLLGERGKLLELEAVRYVAEACRVVQYAHEHGVLHRSLSPENVFLARAPSGGVRVKILDFGSSKLIATDGAISRATANDEIVGIPNHVSPEQLRSSKDVDVRADVWSLGSTLYEAVAGVPPFPGRNLAEIAAKVFTAPPAPLRPHGASAELERIVLRCLEKDPEKRFASVSSLERALSRLCNPVIVGDTAEFSISPRPRRSYGGLVLGVVLVALAFTSYVAATYFLNP